MEYFWPHQSLAIAALQRGPVSPEETQDMRIQDTGSRELRCVTKGVISVSPDACIFPYTEKRYIP